MSRAYLVILLLHAYIGVRLVPDLAVPGAAQVLAWLAASAVLMPHGFGARRGKRAGVDARVLWAGLIAMGSFSSLVVLTMLRDLALLVLRLAHLDATAWRAESAL